MAFSRPPVYDKCIFFENSKSQIDAIRERCGASVLTDELPPGDMPSFIVVDVGETKHSLSLRGGDFTRISELPFYNPDNAYVKYLASRGEISDAYDPLCGIKQDHIDNILIPWVGAGAAGEKRVAVFDWDRTLTVIEGIILEYIDAIIRKYITPVERMSEEILKYLCGGPERLAMLRTMFQLLRDNNIDICIMTNNPSANQRGVYYNKFKHLIQTLVFGEAINHAYPLTIIYAAQGFDDTSANKALVFGRHPPFSARICPRAGGKRRTVAGRRIGSRKRQNRKRISSTKRRLGRRTRRA